MPFTVPDRKQAQMALGDKGSVLCLLAAKVKTEPEEPKPTESAIVEPSEARESRVAFSKDKKRYNKFNYKLRQADKAFQDRWAIIKSQEFVDPRGSALNSNLKTRTDKSEI